MTTAREAPVQSYSRTLISASHILHAHDILDAYGHVSVRHPEKSDIFVMPRNIAPATVCSDDDLVEYYVADASPVNRSSAPAGYAERYIHSEIYKAYESIRSVVHSHSAAVIPYTVSPVPLRPCIHIAGFLGSLIPVFDISGHYNTHDTRNLLVNNIRLGSSLASYFSFSDNKSTQEQKQALTHSVVLMRGHGMTVVGDSIEEAVLRAIYTAENASVQTTSLALTMNFAATTHGVTENGGVKYLLENELLPAADITKWSAMRPWNLWLREVELGGLYSNQAV